MRVERERLITLALAVLYRARLDARGGAIKPGADVRLALAVLFSFSRSGERQIYDRFWRNLSEPFRSAFSDSAANTWRANEAHACFEKIARDVGAPADKDYRAKINVMVSGAPKHLWRPGSAFISSGEA